MLENGVFEMTTLWKVGDESTRSFMTTSYDHWTRQAISDPGAALIETKKYFMFPHQARLARSANLGRLRALCVLLVAGARNSYGSTGLQCGYWLEAQDASIRCNRAANHTLPVKADV